MTGTSARPDGWDHDASAPRPAEPVDPRSLRRSRNDRVVAGVLGGVGRRVGIDPVILRVVVAVLSVFGGVGVMLYALGWLLLPEEGEETSLASAALAGGAGRSSQTVVKAAALAAAALIAMTAAFQGSFSGIVITLSGIAGLVYLLRRGATTPTTPSAPTAGRRVDGRPVDDAPEAAGPEMDPVTYPAAEPSPVPPRSATTVVGGWAAGPDWEEQTEAWLRGADSTPPVPEVPSLPEPAPRRHSRMLWWLTLSAVAIALAALVALDGAWADVPPGAYVATALGVVGLGLIVGTWFGRSRGLIGLGVALVLALVPATFVENFGMAIGDVTVQPTSVAELEAQADLNRGVGTTTYDLTGVEFTDADEVTVTVQHGIGTVEVFVDDTVDVELDAQVGLGQVIFGGEQHSGSGTNLSRTDLGSDGPGGGTLTLDLQVGVGDVVVVR